MCFSQSDEYEQIESFRHVCLNVDFIFKLKSEVTC